MERSRLIDELDGASVDMIVIGGGVTGAGVALDAATRGLEVVLLEADDLAAGSSSASTKLIHGGLRYLEQLDLALVREALSERGRLARDLCPHLVQPLPFLFPVRSVWERAYVGAGVTLYDGLAMAGGDRLPRHRHLGRTETAAVFPELRVDDFHGSIRYWDAQVDDARHTLAVARTAAAHGARILTDTPVVEMTGTERVEGVVFTDRSTGERHRLGASVVVNATGPSVGSTERLAGGRTSLQMRVSKGVHLVLPGERIRGEGAVIARTATSVLFVIPFGSVWLLGTTDTEWSPPPDRVVASRADVDYLLEQANALLTSALDHSDIIGVFSGLRPLIQGASDSTAKLSREHLTASPRPGLVSIAGGKYTTYRIMAADAVDHAAEFLGAHPGPSRTAEIPLVGATGYDSARAEQRRWQERAGIGPAQVEHLLHRYGAEISHVVDIMTERPTTTAMLDGTCYHEAEIVWAARHEGVQHVSDALARRTRARFDSADRGWAAAERVAAILGEEAGWSSARRQAEITAYRAGIEGARAAESRAGDADALAAFSRFDTDRDELSQRP